MPTPPTISGLLKRIQGEPNVAELYQQLGNLYFKKGMKKKAKSAYERSLELDPCDPWTRLYIGNWHYSVDEDRKTVEYFEQAARLLPNIAAPFWALGDAYAALGVDFVNHSELPART